MKHKTIERFNFLQLHVWTWHCSVNLKLNWTRKQTVLDCSPHPDLDLRPWLSIPASCGQVPYAQIIKVKGQLVHQIEWKQTDGQTRPIALSFPLTLGVSFEICEHTVRQTNKGNNSLLNSDITRNLVFPNKIFFWHFPDFYLTFCEFPNSKTA